MHSHRLPSGVHGAGNVLDGQQATVANGGAMPFARVWVLNLADDTPSFQGERGRGLLIDNLSSMRPTWSLNLE